MKRVSFEVANALKEAGYPQDFPELIGLSLEEKNSEETECYFYKDYIYDISLLKKANIKYLAVPTYLEAWLWLWREKGKFIDLIKDCNGRFIAFYGEDSTECCESSDPEEAIIAAIEYLINNDLIK